MPVLKIKAISAQLKKDYDLLTKQDPYCIVRVGEQNKYTKVCDEGGKTPKWYEQILFYLSGQQKQCKVSIFDKDILNDQLIGQGSFLLQKYKQNPNQTQVYHLYLTKDECQAGTVLLYIEWQTQKPQ